MAIHPPVSVFIRTRNEARLIGDVIRAARGLSDDVVVVDSGSIDETRSIAEALGARVYVHEWAGNGRQKRIAEDLCRHDWLLDLDADEVPTPELVQEISTLFVNGQPPLPVYRTPLVIVPPFGKPWIGFGGVVRYKFYDRRVVRAPDHVAWDQFDIPVDIAAGRLAHPILHYAFADAAHLMDKLNRNSTVRANALPLKPLPVLVMRIAFGLPFYVGKRYILDGLLRGGVYGLAFSMMSGFGRWLRDVKMLERRMRGDPR